MGDFNALRRGESGGDAGRREKSYITWDTGDLGFAFPEDMRDRILPKRQKSLIIRVVGIGEGTKSDKTTESAFIVDDGKLIVTSLLHFRNRFITR